MEAICEYCGDTFYAQRSTAKYCSNTCRIKYNALPDNIESLTSAILDRLNKLADLALDYDHLTLEVVDSIVRVKNLCHEIEFNTIGSEKIIRLQNDHYLIEHNNAVWKCVKCGQMRVIDPKGNEKCPYCGRETHWIKVKG